MRYLIGFFLGFTLTSCHAQSLTYEYLMQHPKQLQQEYTRCTQGENQDEAQCKTIKQAAADFLQLVEERNRDPEEFGSHIMQVQTRLATAKLDPAEKQKQVQQLHTLYAVIAATTSE